MGVYLANGVYLPDEGEIGWADEVNADLAALDVLVGSGPGGGSGGTANLIDATAAPYNADPTGVAYADTAIQNAFDAAFNIGPGSGVWLPGIFKVRRNLAHFEVDGITVAMPRGAKLILGDDMGGSALFSCLGRHGYSAQDTCDGTFLGVQIDGNGRLYSGEIWSDHWQGQDWLWRDCQVWDFKGAVWSLTACRRPRIVDCTVTNSGAAENGMAVIDWHHTDEGGDIGRRTEFGSLQNVTITGAKDFAVYWALVRNSSMIGCNIDGMDSDDFVASYRPQFAGVDLEFCTIQGNSIVNSYEDCMRLSSRGVATSGVDGTFSHDNVVTGNVMLGEGAGPGTFYGIREFAPYAGVSHAGNVIEHNVGTVQID